MTAALRILGHRASINVRKVVWCCEELSVPHVREDWGIGFRTSQSAEFLALNPNGLVPVIDDGGYVLSQSNAILRYLGNTRGETLYPKAARARGLIDQWIDWQATELNDAWRYCFMNRVRKSPAHRDETAVQHSVSQWANTMAVLEKQLEGRTFLLGSEFTLADIPIGLSVHRWFSTPIARPELALVQSYYQRLQRRPAFAAQIDVP